MDWENSTKWLWRPNRITKRRYPPHGTSGVTGGKLKGSTETDYFHFDCPRCDENPYGLDAELLGVRDDSDPRNPTARSVMFGLSCPKCGFADLVKIPCLETEDYQPRRIRWAYRS